MVIAVVLVLAGLALMVVLCGGGLFLFSARSVPGPASAPTMPVPTTIEVQEQPTLESQPVEREDSPMP